MTDKIDIEEVNKIPPFTFDAKTLDFNDIKITVEELIKWINNLEWERR